MYDLCSSSSRYRITYCIMLLSRTGCKKFSNLYTCLVIKLRRKVFLSIDYSEFTLDNYFWFWSTERGGRRPLFSPWLFIGYIFKLNTVQWGTYNIANWCIYVPIPLKVKFGNESTN